MYTWVSDRQEAAFNKPDQQFIWLLRITVGAQTRYVTSADRTLFGYASSIVEVAPVSQKLNTDRTVSVGRMYFSLVDDGFWRDLVSTQRLFRASVRFSIGTIDIPESEFIHLIVSPIQDWDSDGSIVRVQCADPKFLNLDKQVDDDLDFLAFRGHPLDAVAACFAENLGTDNYISTSFDPTTSMSDRAHWMLAFGWEFEESRAQNVRSGSLVIGDNLIDTTTTYKTIFDRMMKLLPGVIRPSLGDGRLEFVELDPFNDTPVATLTENDAVFSTDGTINELKNEIVWRTHPFQEPDTMYGDITISDTASVALYTTHRSTYTEEWITGMPRVISEIVTGDGVGTNHLMIVDLSNVLTGWNRFHPMSGTYGLSSLVSQIPAGRELTATRLLSLMFVAIDNPSTYEMMTFDQMTDSTSLGYQIRIAARAVYGANPGLDWNTATRLDPPGTSGTPAAGNIHGRIFDVTIQRYMSEWELAMKSDGTPKMRVKGHYGLIRFEIGDAINVISRKYTNFNRRDGATASDYWYVIEKKETKDGIELLLQRFTTGAAVTVGVVSSPPPIGTTNQEPYLDAGGAIYTDASGVPYYSRS